MYSLSYPSSLTIATSYPPFMLSSVTHASIHHTSSSIAPRRLCERSRFRLFASSPAERSFELSWFPSDNHAVADDCGGWAIVHSMIDDDRAKKGLPSVVLGGIGISIALLLAVFAQSSLRSRGFQFSSELQTLKGMLMSSRIKAEHDRTAANWGAETPTSVFSEKPMRVIVPVGVDSTQQEALSFLQRLKIIEDNVKPNELCTKREYARWLVRANSLLERNPKHRILPSVLPSGSLVVAFDDISTDDPDFWPIQALAEAGIVYSKLSTMNSILDLNSVEDHEGVYFLPESSVSRQDLIMWKAQLEYNFMLGTEDKIAKAKIDLMDIKEIKSDAPPELFMDILAGDNSIHRKAFGQSRRFQPNKPSTKVQAAVAVASGRMTEAINTELLRLEAEDYARQAEMEDIKSELLRRGEVQSFWDEKFSELNSKGLEVERAHLDAIRDLELEKLNQEKNHLKYSKEKAAIDCQRQLLRSLEAEVSGMSEKLTCERGEFMAEQNGLQNMLHNLQTKQEGLLDAKSVLEAEKEAIRILRSWVEDEARKNQARAKVLEEVGRRWRWETPA